MLCLICTYSWDARALASKTGETAIRCTAALCPAAPVALDLPAKAEEKTRITTRYTEVLACVPTRANTAIINVWRAKTFGEPRRPARVMPTTSWFADASLVSVSR